MLTFNEWLKEDWRGWGQKAWGKITGKESWPDLTKEIPPNYIQVQAELFADRPSSRDPESRLFVNVPSVGPRGQPKNLSSKLGNKVPVFFSADQVPRFQGILRISTKNIETKKAFVDYLESKGIQSIFAGTKVPNGYLWVHKDILTR